MGPSSQNYRCALNAGIMSDSGMGRVTAGRHSHYRREWTLARGRRPSRADHLPPSVFGRVAFLADVKTVVRDQGQHALIPENQYSIIARLVERVAGGAQP